MIRLLDVRAVLENASIVYLHLRSRPELLLETELKREPNYLYYVDPMGDIARVKAARGCSLRKGQKRRKTATQRMALFERRLRAAKLRNPHLRALIPPCCKN